MPVPREDDSIRPRIAAVVPAAGASARFHGFPKACLDIGGEPAVRRIVRLALEEGCSPVIVVAGPHEPEIRRVLSGEPVHIVAHPDWASGRTGSIQAGLGRAPPGEDAILWPVDHPFVDGRTLATLTVARRHDDLALWFIPMYHGEGGHPVLLRAEAIAAVRNLRPSDPLRGLLPHLGAQVRRVAVGDPGVVANTDTPEEYHRHLEAWRQRWTGD